MDHLVILEARSPRRVSLSELDFLLTPRRGTQSFFCPSQVLEAAYASCPMTQLLFPKSVTGRIFLSLQHCYSLTSSSLVVF